jgi:hypothetical protein
MTKHLDMIVSLMNISNQLLVSIVHISGMIIPIFYNSGMIMPIVHISGMIILIVYAVILEYKYLLGFLQLKNCYSKIVSE